MSTFTLALDTSDGNLVYYHIFSNINGPWSITITRPLPPNVYTIKIFDNTNNSLAFQGGPLVVMSNSNINPPSQNPGQPIPTPGNPEPVLNVVGISGNISLTWPSLSSAQYYAIYLDGDLFATTTMTSFNPGAIFVPDSDNYFTVMAYADQAMAAATVPSTEPSPTRIVVHAAPALPVPTQGPLRALAIIVNMAPNSDGHGGAINFESVDALTRKLFDTTSSTTMSTYYKIVSFGKLAISGNVVNVTIPYRANFPTNISDFNNISSLFPVINSYASSTLVAKANVIYYVWPQIASGMSGRAQSIGSRGVDPDGGIIVKGWVWVNGPQSSGVYAHETGHIFGLSHGDAIQNLSCLVDTKNCTVGYYSGFDINYYGDYQMMGSDQTLRGDLTSHDKAVLGWVPDQAITKTGLYTIIGGRNPNTKAIHIDKPDSKDKYYLESGASDNCKFSWYHTLCLGYVSISVEKGQDDIAAVKKTSVGEMLRIIGDRSPIPTGIIDGNVDYYLDATNTIVVDGLTQKVSIPSAQIFVRFGVSSPILLAKTLQNGQISVSWMPIDPVAGTTIVYSLWVCAQPGGTAVTGCYHLVDTTKTEYIAPSSKPSPPNGYFYVLNAYDTFPDLRLKDSFGQDKRFPIPFYNHGWSVNLDGSTYSSVLDSLPSNSVQDWLPPSLTRKK